MASSPRPTKPSTPRLSDRAKVVYPSGIVTTGWPEVARQHQRMGIRFDWFQVAISKLALSKRADGTYAATVGGVVLSIPRQVGKTFMLCGLLFALCLIHPGFTALWTAQQLRTAKETLRAMQGFARRKAIKPFIAYVRVANGEGEVGFVNGSRILFGARDHGFGLGMSDVDLLVFDEGQRLGETALDDMLPTQNRAKNPLFFIVGTPPRPTDTGEVFIRKRAEALSGEADDLVFVEFSADRNTTPRDKIDWDQVARANPSFPDHTPRTAVLRMWKNLGPDSFWREGYGIWDENASTLPLIDSATWSGRKVTEPPPPGVQAYGVKFSPDDSTIALATARRPDTGPTHVEVVKVASAAAGTGWLADWLEQRWRKAAVIVIDGRAGLPLVTELRKRHVPQSRIVTPTMPQVIEAHAGFLEAVRTEVLTHYGQPGLDEVVADATKRPIGDKSGGGWGWAPISDDTDVTPLDAVTYAHYGATTTRRRPAGDASSRWAGVA